METKVRCPKCGSGFGFQKPPAEIVLASPEASAAAWASECERLTQAITVLLWHSRVTTAAIAVAEMARDIPAAPDLPIGEFLSRCLGSNPAVPFTPGAIGLLKGLQNSLEKLSPERVALLKASVRGVLLGWSMGMKAGGDDRD